MNGGGSCAVCKRQIALTRAGVNRQHGLVRARCSRSGLPPSRCILSRPETVSAGDLNQLPVPSVPPASITYDSHSGGTQSRALDDWDNAAGVDAAASDMPEIPIPSSLPLEPPELVLPPDVIQSIRVLKRVPRVSRHLAVTKLPRFVEDVSVKNDSRSWSRLFKFGRRCLAVPRRGGRRRNLASAVNAQLQEEAEPPSNLSSHLRSKHRPSPNGQANGDFRSLAKRVSSKLEDGDYRGAVCAACSISEDANRGTFGFHPERTPEETPFAASRDSFSLSPNF